MNWRTVRLLFIHEMRMLLRARRTVVTAIVLPAIIMPLMLLGSRYSEERRQRQAESTTYRYAVSGTWTAKARTLIASVANAPGLPPFAAEEVSSKTPDADLESGSIDFYVQTAEETGAQKVPGIEVVFRGNRDPSQTGANRMLQRIRQAQRMMSNAALVQAGFPGKPGQQLQVVSDDIATAAQVSGSTAGRFLTVILVMLMFTGGSVAAMDIISGEKERGTLETLLTTAAGRSEIVTAKQLTICSVAFVTTIIQALNFVLYVRLKLIKLPEGFSFNIPLPDIAMVFALFVPMAAAIAATLLTVSAIAKTYKEAQLYFFPLYLGSMVPALASILPGIRLRSIVAFIPVANVSVAVREVLTGRPDPAMLVVTFVVMTLTAGALMRYSAGLLSRESVIVSAQHEQALLIGGEALFRKRVLQWFAVMWAVMFAFAANIPQLQTFRAQLLFNEIVIFLGASLAIAGTYRLNLRKVLDFRAVAWPVWIAILVAVPTAQITALAFFKLVNRIVPAPAAMLEDLSKQILPAGMPTWQLYCFVAILPAVCEELAFRGILLRGLRHRFRPAVLCVVVGVIFGIFHYTLFRIAPTAFLGVILTAIAVMTGSILPGIAFHAANNALAVWTGTAGWNFDGMRWPGYAAATAIFLLSMGVIYTASRRQLKP